MKKSLLLIDANSLGSLPDDNDGPNNELGGTPYDYESVTWSETYKNPGYTFDNNGTPEPMDNSTDPLDLLGYLSGIVGKVQELALETIQTGIQSSKEILSQSLINNFSNITIDPDTGVITIDSTQDAVIHYYTGKGKSVELGSNTVQRIKNSSDVAKYRKRIETGLTQGPASGSGLGIDMTWDDFHLGNMTLSYTTVCNIDTCTTTYVVDDRGFVDPNSLGYIIKNDDNEGPNNELGGTPNDYAPVTWSETYKNPGYKFDANGRPQPINP